MPHMEGIFINGEKAKFHPEDILDTDASQYTEEIGESVTAYLTEHITNPPIDTSLSIAGAAADAKETGVQISQLKSEFTALESDGVVPSAEQILTDKGVTDSVPYHYRKTVGDGADREYVDAIVGGTVNWNQWVRNGDFADGSNRWSAYNSNNVEISAENGVLTARFLNDSDGGYQYGVYTDYQNSDGTLRKPITGHVYMITAEVKATATGKYGVDTNGTSAGKFSDVTAANVWTSLNKIFVAQDHPATSMIILPSTRITTADTMQIRSVMFTDLTAMFGSAIADYIYQLEQATAGAGVAFFKALFPNDYYPYNSSELVSVSGLSAHKMTGFNQWDEEWEVGYISVSNGQPVDDGGHIRSKNFNRCVSNTAYYYKGNNNRYVFWYDADKNFIEYNYRNSSDTATIMSPANASYFKVRVEDDTNTYNHDICINLSDPAKNGTYEPYKAHSYPLDSTLTLRGIPKLVDGKMCFDGDTYDADGTVTRRYGIVDLGTLTWKYQSTLGVFYVDNVNVKAVGSCLCPKYISVAPSNPQPDKSITLGGNGWFTNDIAVVDSAYTDANTFKTAMSGVMLAYELATPTTEQATPYQHLQQCDPNGTEEYVSTGIVPVGHNSFYPENLRAKVEQLPWNFATLIAPTESTFTATRNYTTGSLFIVNNVLYKATSNIANGGAITPNTNCTATTLAEIISALA